MKFSPKYILLSAVMFISAVVSAQSVDSTAVITISPAVVGDSVVIDNPPLPAVNDPTPAIDAPRPEADSIVINPDGRVPADTTARRGFTPFLSSPISGSSQDSMVYDVKNNKVYLYNKGDVVYEEKTPLNLKGDRLRLNLDNKEVEANGVIMLDSAGKRSRPQFLQGSQAYDMDSLRYNLDSKRGVIYGSTTKQGEGYMIARKVKMHEDNVVDAKQGLYTTCNHLDHPHFYIAMTKARMIPGKKAIFGTAYFVLEDVPLYFPFIPFGFFPLMTGPGSGFIMPSFGEEYSKGFFLRGGGYYFRINDHVDAQVTGSIFTLGSWDAHLGSRYMKRYKFTGDLSFDYANNKLNREELSGTSYSLKWNHRMDPKAKPGTTFSASVNFTSSGHSRVASQTMSDRLNTQTNSTIAFGQTWRPGRGWFPGGNFQMSLRTSQNARDSSITISFPQASWGLNKFKPFKRKEAMGKERWYEKLSLSYTGGMDGNVNTKEKYLFKEEMFDNLKTGVNHKVPISVAWTLFDYVNFTPNATYSEDWHFRRYDRRWDQAQQTVVRDTTAGFWRVWDFSMNVSTGTKIYGMFLMKNTEGWLKAVRHVLTPSAGFTFHPDTGKKYQRQVQSSPDGTMTTYTPFEGRAGGAKSASMSFSLQQNLEAKVRDGDTVRVIKIIDNLSISSSYNFMAERFKLANFGVNFSTPIYKNYVLRFNATLDPYSLDGDGNRIDRIRFRDGKLPRLINFGTSFSWQLSKSLGYGEVINDIGTQPIELTDSELEMLDPNARLQYEMDRRRRLGNTYYDFSIPYNISLNYSFSYTNNGRHKRITQTVGFNGSLTLTPYQTDGNNRWGISFNGGYDFQMKRPTLGNIAITRDLHCFVMSLNWMPIGLQRSWSFNIRVKASVLKDLKYDKNRSMYDNTFD